MYYTEKDPFSGKKLFVEKNLHRKALQKQIITNPGRSKTGGTQKPFEKHPLSRNRKP